RRTHLSRSDYPFEFSFPRVGTSLCAGRPTVRVMIDLVQQYWQQYLWGTSGHPTGLVITLWLTVASLALGFILALPLAVLRVSRRWWLSMPVRIYTYVIRGTPLYVQLLLVYTGIYSLDAVRATPFLNTFFRDAMNCTILAFMLNTAAYTIEI